MLINQDDKEVVALITLGVEETINKLYVSIHSEDDHGYDLYKWLEGRKQAIISEAYNKVLLGRALLVD